MQMQMQSTGWMGDRMFVQAKRKNNKRKLVQ